MAYDKIIDSSKLDAAMTASADAIRVKTGGTAKIAWDESNGFSSAISQIKGKRQTKTVTPKATSQTVKPDSGYDGLSQVTVNGDSDLKAANIAKGVNIFGIIGTLESGSKVATGTFTQPQISMSWNITVTGLGFTPSKIYIFEELTAAGYKYDDYVAYMVADGNENFVAFPTTVEEYDEEYDEYYKYVVMETRKDLFTATMNSNGFVLTPISPNGYRFREGATCRYIAFA